MFYVLIGFNTKPDYDEYRVETIHHYGANPFVMPFDKSQPYQRHFARWCNNKAVFKSTLFADYQPWVAAQKQMMEAA